MQLAASTLPTPTCICGSLTERPVQSTIVRRREYLSQEPVFIHIVLFAVVLHPRSYQDEYKLVTVHTHGIFIVLLHWESRLPAHYPDAQPTSPLPYFNNGECLAKR